jgi:hypothetical protein
MSESISGSRSESLFQTVFSSAWDTVVHGVPLEVQALWLACYFKSMS